MLTVTVRETTALDILEEVRRIIDSPEKWTKDAMARDIYENPIHISDQLKFQEEAISFSLYGAFSKAHCNIVPLAYVMIGGKTHYREVKEMQQFLDAKAEAEEAINSLTRLTSKFPDMLCFNNDFETTYEDVIDLLNECIRRKRGLNVLAPEHEMIKLEIEIPKQLYEELQTVANFYDCTISETIDRVIGYDLDMVLHEIEEKERENLRLAVGEFCRAIYEKQQNKKFTVSDACEIIDDFKPISDRLGNSSLKAKQISLGHLLTKYHDWRFEDLRLFRCEERGQEEDSEDFSILFQVQKRVNKNSGIWE